MIYITGDTHGVLERFNEINMPNENSWTSDDKLIVCGDFGFVWYSKDNLSLWEKNQNTLDVLAKKPYEILFICGNHENFDELNKYPEVERYGNLVHKIRDNIYHLQRGRIYDIEGKAFFTFGGAYSIDKYMRREGVTWWKEELPNALEYERGINSLEKRNYNVDYIITHTAPNDFLELIKYRLPACERNNFTLDSHDWKLRSYLNGILSKTQFNRWYFGHWHLDMDLSQNARAIYFDVEKIKK